MEVQGSSRGVVALMSLQTTRGKPRQAGIPIEVPDKLLLVLRVMGELSLRLEVAGYHAQRPRACRLRSGTPATVTPAADPCSCCPHTQNVEWTQWARLAGRAWGLPHCRCAGRLEDACPRGKPSTSALQCPASTLPRGVWSPRSAQFRTRRAWTQPGWKRLVCHSATVTFLPAHARNRRTNFHPPAPRWSLPTDRGGAKGWAEPRCAGAGTLAGSRPFRRRCSGGRRGAPPDPGGSEFRTPGVELAHTLPAGEVSLCTSQPLLAAVFSARRQEAVGEFFLGGKEKVMEKST